MAGHSLSLETALLTVVFGLFCYSCAGTAVDCTFRDSYPNQYVTYFVDDANITLDGKIDEPAWLEVPFTSNFVDISTTTIPKFITKSKIRWSNDYLYVAAYLEESQIWANITSTCHCIDSSEDQVIYHDNDFEIFVDPDGDTHYYKEYEMNAYNATWDLILNKPYADGGYENSSRVFGSRGFDMQPPLANAVYIGGGSINDPGSHNRFWSVEVALPLSKLAVNESVSLPPAEGSYWRINFSRVEWNVEVMNNQYYKDASCQSCSDPGTALEDNWVWSPMGVVNMHAPNNWGMLQFTSNNPSEGTSASRNPEWPIRSVAMILYHAEHEYWAVFGVYTDDMEAVDKYANPPILASGACTSGVPVVLLAEGNQTFVAMVEDVTHTLKAQINQDRLLLVEFL